MASSSKPNASDEMDQLVKLQRAGLLAMSEFVRMSREIAKTDAERLAEAPPGETHDGVPFSDASSKISSTSEMLVDESGDVFDAAAATTLDESDGVDGVEEDDGAAWPR